MVTLGIIFGLLAAALQATSYVFSRIFVMKSEKPVICLFVITHLLMGAAGLVLLPFLMPEEAIPLKQYFLPLTQAAGFYLIGQLILLWIMQRTEASRVSPLLGFKIVILALLSVLMMKQDLTLQKWIAVFLCVAASFLLNFTGGRLPMSVVIAGLVLCTGYSLSDLGIAKLITALDTAEHPALLATCVTYLFCGVVAIALLPAAGFQKVLINFRYSGPFTLCWFSAMFCLYTCFGYVGPLFGNVLQSTRGIISVLLGVLIARMGHVIIEQKQPGHVVLRRAGAALLMTIAIWLFLAG